MKSIFDSFVGLNSISKTIRMELRPVGKTLENIEQFNLIPEDQDRAEKYMQHSEILQQDFGQYRQMYKRSNGDFTRDILRAGLEDAPELPEEVVGYLCRNYKYDSSANGVGLRFNTYGQKKLQLEYIIADINRRVIWLKDTAKFCDREFGSMGCDLEDQVYMNPGVREMSGPLEAASDLLEDYPAGTYRKESDFLTKQVIPSIEAVIKAIDDKIATTNEQPASEPLSVA